jgi:hypothetical protein
MDYSDLPKFVATLFPPLGFAGEACDASVIKKRIGKLWYGNPTNYIWELHM